MNLLPPPSRIILTNSMNNERSAVIANSAQIPVGIKPYFDEPPPPYHSVVNDTSHEISSPPSYEELDQLPGSIMPSSTIQFHAPSLPRKY